MEKGRITGVGGIFFKCDDPKKMREWYRDQFGLITDDYGALFEFRQATAPEKPGYLQWSTMSKDSKHFEPSKSDFMVNYRVEHIEALVERLREDGVTILDDIETCNFLAISNRSKCFLQKIIREFQSFYSGYIL